MNEHLQKSLNHFKKIQPAESKAELEKVQSDLFSKISVIDSLIIENNSLACHILTILHGIITTEKSEAITEKFNVLLNKIQALPLNEERYEVHIYIAYNYVCWLFINDVSKMENINICERIWNSLTYGERNGSNPFFYLLRNLVLLLHLIHGNLQKIETMLKESNHLLEFQSSIKLKKYLPVLILPVFCHPMDLTCSEEVSHFSNVIYDMYLFIKTCFLTIKMKYEEAISVLQIIKNSEILSIAGSMKAYLLFKTSENSSSIIEHLQILIKNERLDRAMKAQIHNIIGYCLAKQLKPNMAIKFFQSSLQDDATFLCALYNIVVMYHSLKNTSAELEALSILSSVIPDTDLNTNNLLIHISENALVKLNKKSRIFMLAGNYIHARRLLELSRFDEAVTKYLDIISFMRSSEIIQVTSTDYINFPPLKCIYKEAAFALYMCGRYEDSITVCCNIEFSNSEKIMQSNKLKFDPCSNFKEFSSLPLEIQQTLQNDNQFKPCKSQQDRNINEFSIENISTDEILLWMVESYSLLKISKFSEGIKTINRVLICLYDSTVEQNIKKCKALDSLKLESDSSKNCGSEVEMEEDNSEEHINSPFIDHLKAQAYNCQALFLIQQGCLNDALHNLRLACQLHPDMAPYIRTSSRQSWDENQMKEAIEAVQAKKMGGYWLQKCIMFHSERCYVGHKEEKVLLRDGHTMTFDVNLEKEIVEHLKNL